MKWHAVKDKSGAYEIRRSDGEVFGGIIIDGKNRGIGFKLTRRRKFMNSYIGCLCLVGIAGFIVLLFLRRKRIENEMTLFYQTHSLYRTTDEPPNVRESLGVSENLYCCRANLAAAGESVEFCWWEWYVKSSQVINGVSSVSFTHFLAFSFAPNSVSNDFINKALQSTDRSKDSAGQKSKTFSLPTHKIHIARKFSWTEL